MNKKKLIKKIVSAAAVFILFGELEVQNVHAAINDRLLLTQSITYNDSLSIDENIDESQYGNVSYVDANYTGNSDGSKTKPFKDIDDALRAIGKNDLVVLGAGTYYLNTAKIRKKISVIGQGKDTELVFDAGYMRNALNNTYCHYDFAEHADFYKMCISFKGRDSYSNYLPLNKRVYFNNVLFKDLYDAGYSIFLLNPEGYLQFNNCTFTKSFKNLFRDDDRKYPRINIRSTYVNPTSYNRNTSGLYTINNSITFSGTPNLDSNYKINESDYNDRVGVYTGKYAWR